jgi:hypothetical protein
MSLIILLVGKPLAEKIELKVFNEYIGDDPHLSEKLYDYDDFVFDERENPTSQEH